MCGLLSCCKRNDLNEECSILRPDIRRPYNRWSRLGRELYSRLAVEQFEDQKTMNKPRKNAKKGFVRRFGLHLLLGLAAGVAGFVSTFDWDQLVYWFSVNLNFQGESISSSQ